jgi:molecular chaperone IbpA
MALATTQRVTTPFALLDRMLADLPRPVAAHGTDVGYDLVKTGEDSYRLALAVPGLTENELAIETERRTLVVRARPAAAAEHATVLHRGIPRGAFERRFALGEHVRVDGAELAHGILAIRLVREVPQALRPRTIAIDKAA